MIEYSESDTSFWRGIEGLDRILHKDQPQHKHAGFICIRSGTKGQGHGQFVQISSMTADKPTEKKSRQQLNLKTLFISVCARIHPINTTIYKCIIFVHNLLLPVNYCLIVFPLNGLSNHMENICHDIPSVNE